ncbi:hypothetical protein B0H34DRAFT_123450 [Crassisporium funariophilum]|nr:hypothetical protein B0H34DRAFT_123450 [Crassisporium funariophilum]
MHRSAEPNLPKLLEALQTRKCKLKHNRFDFMETYLANEEDYTIDGKLTEFAVEELLSLGRLDELEELLSNAKELLAGSTVV